MARPPGAPPPCDRCPKVPDDAPAKHWDYAVELSQRNERVYRHYLECKAVGSFPDDPIVRRHAGIIRRVEDAAANREVVEKLDTLSALMGVILGGLGSQNTAGGRPRG